LTKKGALERPAGGELFGDKGYHTEAGTPESEISDSAQAANLMERGYEDNEV